MLAKQIKFVLPWRGREPGIVNSELDPNVMQILVQRGIAVPHTPDQKPSRVRRSLHADSGDGTSR